MHTKLEKPNRRRYLPILLAVLLFFNLAISIPSANAQPAEEAGIAMETANGMNLEAGDKSAQETLDELGEAKGAVLFGASGISTRASNMTVTLSYTRTISYDNFFTRNYRVEFGGKTMVAYCVQPALPPAGNEKDFTAIDYNSAAMIKALYYSWGYPGFDKKLAAYIDKRADDDDWSDKDGAYALCHMILSYFYDHESASSDAFMSVSADTKALVIKCASYIKTLPDPPTDTSISISRTVAESVWDAGNSWQKTQTFKLNTHEDNSVSLTVPSGTVLHKTAGGETSEKTYAAGKKVKIYGGDTFYFTGNRSLKGSYSSGNLEGSLANFNPYLIRKTGVQDIFFCGKGATDTVSFKVNWVERGWMTAKKIAGDWEMARDELKNVYMGMEFTLSGNGLPSQILTVGSDGKLQGAGGSTKIDDLMPGSYRLRETRLPDRYRAPGVDITIPIRAGAGYDVPEAEMVNDIKTGKWSVTKFWKADGKLTDSAALQREGNITFRIWDHAYFAAGWSFADTPATFKDEITTNERGEAVTKDLPVGTYRVEQVTSDASNWKVPDFAIAITEDKEVCHFDLLNAPVHNRVKLIKTDGETGRVIKLAGTQFQVRDAAGNKVTQVRGNNPADTTDTFTTNAEGEAWLPEDLTYGTYRVIEVKAPYGYVKSDTQITFTIDTNTKYGETVEVVFANKPQKARVHLTKLGETFDLDESGNARFQASLPLAYVVFDLVAAEDIETPDGTVRVKKGDIAEQGLMTDEKGHATSKTLYLGTYHIVERGFKEKQEIYALTEMDVTNILTAYQLSVRRETGQPPTAGRAEEVKALLGKEVLRVNGAYQLPEVSQDQTLKHVLDTYLADLPESQITVSYPDAENPPYSIPGDPVDTVALQYGGQDQEVVTIDRTIVNHMDTGKLVLSKRDITTGEGLPNTGVRIYDQDKKQIYEGRTNGAGNLILERLPAGSYFFQEYDAPFGYVLDDSLHAFTIEKDQITRCELTNRPQTGSIHLEKGGETYQIKDNQFQYTKTEALADAKFEIVAAEDILSPGGRLLVPKGTAVDTITTDQAGKAKSKELHLGSYLVREVEAPKGYVISKPVKVTLTYQGQRVPAYSETVKLDNRLARGKVIITKTDVSTGKTLSDTGIRILDQDKKKLLEGRTDEKGKLTFDALPIGTYYFQEFDAPKGYQLSEKLFAFEIKTDGDIIKCKMTDKAEITRTPQTGDTARVWIWAITCVLALLTLTVLIIKKRR